MAEALGSRPVDPKGVTELMVATGMTKHQTIAALNSLQEVGRLQIAISELHRRYLGHD